MTPGQAIELSYVIKERERTAKLCAALEHADDVTLTAPGPMKLTVRGPGGWLTHPELPHMLFRSLHENGSVFLTAKQYLVELDRTLLDQFGIVIEEEEKKP
jgi:hypothetical protein